MAKRSTGFDLRQKWQVNEVNCIQILNPAPGATYHPGYFVRMNYGTGQCGGATAASPWSIHLYNNPEIQDGGKIRYDYHEVIADGINEGRTQYTWNIPADQDSRARVRKTSDYYVRVETSSADGVKLVGNAGPFAIYPDLHRRDEATSPSAEFDAKLAPLHRPAKSAPVEPVIAPTTPKVPTKAPIVAPTTPQVLTEAPVPATVDTSVHPNIITDNYVATPETEKHPFDSAAMPNDAPAVSANPGVVAPAALIPVEPVSVSTTGDSSTSSTVSDASVGDLPVPHNLPPVPETGKGEPVTPIAPTSFIPSKAIMVAGIAAGALAVGYGGGALFGAVGSALGAVLGGVVGGLAVLISFTGLPV
ncbi:hypothetical protein CPC16_008940 [Podila verticillata]|nr:hypothetical protein BGZ52_004555 [Haplosporangium bisporale]KAF9215772.1 hypothetical protein BGZ59_000361 [Podila verticillata]KAF9395247.1 hypothetical protein CPC16_008940 [Podila verticillata]KFH69104.1 hypothetical protein MVEG_05905 [Podila verticillata NRRL 6337]